MAAQDPYAAGDPYAQDVMNDAWQEPKRTSVAAVLSLISALIFCIPILTQVLGLLFGVIGLISVSVSGGRRKGAGLAIAGIILSILLMIGYGFLGALGFNFTKNFTAVAQTFVKEVETGVLDDIRALAAPSVANNITDEQIAEFRDRLFEKYGSLQTIETDWRFTAFQRLGQQAPQGSQQSFPWSIKMTFDSAVVYALAIIEPQQNQQVQSVQDALRLKQLIVIDPGGDIWEFPFSAEELAEDAGPTEGDEYSEDDTGPGADDTGESEAPGDG